MRSPEKNPEIRPKAEMPLFEQQAIAHGVERSQLREEVPMRDESQKPSGLELAQVAAKSVPPNTNRGASNLTCNNLENCETRQGGGEIHRSPADIKESGRTHSSGAVQNGDCRSLRDAQSSSSSPRDVARARRSDPETSHAASRSVVNLGRTRDAIIDILRKHGPMTDETIARIYNVRQANGNASIPRRSPSGLRSRRKELCDMGFVEDSGKLGKTAAKRDCAIWKLTPMGEQK